VWRKEPALLPEQRLHGEAVVQRRRRQVPVAERARPARAFLARAIRARAIMTL
jgi:hypothetical protein